MSRIIGRLTSVGIAKEAVRGTAVAPSFWVPVRDLDFDDTVDTKDNESGFGVITGISDSDIIKQWSEGGYEGKIFDKSIGLELAALFGASPTSSAHAGATGAYDHAFALANNNQHLSLTVAVKEANNNLRYVNSIIDTWKFEAALDDYIKRSMKLMGKKGATASDTVAYTAENEFVPRHMVVKVATNLAGLTAASAIKVRNITFEVNKNADGLQVLGSNDIDDVVNKTFEVSGSIEMYYDNTTYRDLVFNNTKQALRISVVNTDVMVGTGTPTATLLQFDFAKCIFGKWERGFDNDDIMTQTVDFKAAFSLSDAATMSALLTNGYAGTLYA